MKDVTKETSKLKAAGRYSLARREGGLLFCSGQIGMDASLKLVPGGVEAEFKQIMENTKDLLETNGLSLKNVIKVIVFLKDVADFKTINELYNEHFTSEPYPVRTTVGVADIPLGASIELDITASAK